MKFWNNLQPNIKEQIEAISLPFKYELEAVSLQAKLIFSTNLSKKSWYLELVILPTKPMFYTS